MESKHSEVQFELFFPKVLIQMMCVLGSVKAENEKSVVVLWM